MQYNKCADKMSQIWISDPNSGSMPKMFWSVCYGSFGERSIASKFKIGEKKMDTKQHPAPQYQI
jgi:hypothetical protein